VELRKALVEVREGRPALVAKQVGAAPPLRRLEGEHLMPAGAQVSENAPLKMGVPVIPVGHEGMGIEDKLHESGRVSRGGGDFGQHIRVGLEQLLNMLIQRELAGPPPRAFA
jgi:hypothetical protein